jgi:hypothetical protein
VEGEQPPADDRSISKNDHEVSRYGVGKDHSRGHAARFMIAYRDPRGRRRAPHAERRHPVGGFIVRGANGG